MKLPLLIRAIGGYEVPEPDFSRILKSQWDAYGKLAKKNVYNRSAGQKGKTGFDKWWFVFLEQKYLPAIREEINAAIDRNDLNYFEDLGKTVERLKKQPADQAINGDPLGHFIATNWLAQPHSSVPSFCLFSSDVLTEACNFGLKEKVTKSQVETFVKNYELERLNGPENLRIEHFGYKGKILYVASHKALLTCSEIHDFQPR